MSSYRERLLPKWWVYALAAGLVSMLSIAYGAAYGQTVGWLMFVVVFGLLALVMTTCSPLILVSDILEVDHARMPLSHIGVVLALNPQQTQAARRSRDHDLDYTLVKLWASTSSVSIRIHDPKDPHPGWLISSRNPEKLSAAITAARAADQETTGPNTHRSETI